MQQHLTIKVQSDDPTVIADVERAVSLVLDEIYRENPDALYATLSRGARWGQNYSIAKEYVPEEERRVRVRKPRSINPYATKEATDAILNGKY